MAKPVTAAELGTILHSRKLRLAILNSCYGACGSPEDPFASVAQSLIRQRVASVIAMQYSVSDQFAVAFSSLLYEKLAQGQALDEAMAETRLALFAEGFKVEWGNPVLYLRGEGKIFDVRDPKRVIKPSSTIKRGGNEESKPPLGVSFPKSRKQKVALMSSLAGLILFSALIFSPYRMPVSSDPVCPSPGNLNLKFARIPAGRFVMGSGQGGDTPEHEVTLSKPFCMGVYEVTQGQWEALMGKNPSMVKGKDLPVTNVSWQEVQEFLRRLDKLDPSGHYRLPTEAEWEYAARAGTVTDFYFGGSAADLYKYGNCRAGTSGDEYENITSVGSFPANPWGLYDIYGNVSEWVADWNYPYGAAPVKDPAAVNLPLVDKVHRGGSWKNSPRNCNSFDRSYGSYTYPREDVGFRIVRDPVVLKK
jgi:formylglycine-generating enzyme required for sulfatase activity